MTDYIKSFIEKKPGKKIKESHPWKKAISDKKFAKDKADREILRKNHG